MHEVYDGLRSKLSSALKEINRTGKLNGAALDELHTITDTIKNIDKIQMLENDGYSQDGGRWEANGGYDSRNSYANRRGSNYVRGYYRGGTMHSGHHDNMSYGDGKTMMIEQLEEMLNNADEKQQTAIRRCLEEIDRY